MTKWGVRICLKRRSGSTNPTARNGAAASRSANTASSSLIGRRRNAGNVFEEVEVGHRCQMDSGEAALCDGDVGLVPEADIRHLARHDALHVRVELEPPRLILGRRG